MAIFARSILATSSKLLVLGEVVLKAAVLHSNNNEANDGNDGEDTNDAANDGPDDAAALWLLDTLIVEQIGVTVTLGADVINISVDTINGETGVFVIKDDIEILHENITKDVFKAVDTVSVDGNLADVLTIHVASLDQVVLGLQDVGTVVDEVEAKVGEQLWLAEAIEVA